MGFALNEFDGVLVGYLTDTYGSITGSALAPLSLLRALLSGIYPLFARQFFRGLGGNVAGSIIAAVATAYCGVAALFWIFGKRIRLASSQSRRIMIDSPSEVRDSCGVGCATVGDSSS
jgi:hypothetical protein